MGEIPVFISLANLSITLVCNIYFFLQQLAQQQHLPQIVSVSSSSNDIDTNTIVHSVEGCDLSTGDTSLNITNTHGLNTAEVPLNIDNTMTVVEDIEFKDD